MKQREIKLRAWVYNPWHFLVANEPEGTGCHHKGKWSMAEVLTIHTNKNGVRARYRKPAADQLDEGSEIIDVRNYDIGEHCHIMQFTGLQDKNGKDIYEGDRMKASWLADFGVTELDCEAIVTVEWCDETSGWVMMLDKFKRSVNYGQGPDESPGVYEPEYLPFSKEALENELISYEVIGNIYEPLPTNTTEG